MRRLLVMILSALLVAAALVGCQPKGPGGNWELIWADEFEGDSLDLSKWRPNWLGGSDSAITPPANGQEVQCANPDQVNVANGTLRLRAEQEACGSFDYASGTITTDNDFHVGPPVFIEAKMFVPGANGDCYNFPAFWTNGQAPWPTNGEIDVYECLSGHSDSWHYHAPNWAPGGYPSGDYVGWHTFGVWWEAGRLRFYYDSILVGTITDSRILSDPHFIILNNGVAPSINPVVVPSTVQFDYVRVWKPA